MRSVSVSGSPRQVRAVVRAALLLLFLGAMPGPPALAQAERAPVPEASAADDEFSKQLSELKKTFGDLSKKIDDSAQSIGRLGSAEAARKEIEELRAYVGALLGAVADNGAVWSLGAQALKRADDKLRALEQETRFRPEDRQFLMEKWRALKVATEGSIRELERARKDFADLLRTVNCGLTNRTFFFEIGWTRTTG